MERWPLALGNGSGKNILFPRSAVPQDIGKKVYVARSEKGWSQSQLSAKCGVTRWTIGRIEAGRHLPSSSLVHALERVLDIPGGRLVAKWKDPSDFDSPAARGPRARQARVALGLTISEIAIISGVSVPTISRFEREMGDTARILGPNFDANDGFTNDAYARAHFFHDSREMEVYAYAEKAEPWLKILIRRRDEQA